MHTQADVGMQVRKYLRVYRMYACLRTYMMSRYSTYIHIYTHTYIHTYIHAYIHTCMIYNYLIVLVYDRKYTIFLGRTGSSMAELDAQMRPSACR